MKTAWCLGGGGSRCIYQFGMIKRAVEVLGLPDIVIGTSGGALNAAGLAMGDLDLMERIWTTVRNKDVRSLAPWQLFTKNKASLFNFDPLRKSMERVIDRDKLLKSRTECYVTVTSLLANCAVRFRLTGEGAHPNPIGALHASCSPPILVPPAEGCFYDGGLSDNYNLGLAMKLGAKHIVMMHPALPGPWAINNVIDAVECAISIPMWNNYQREIDSFLCMPDDARPKLTIIEPVKPPPFSMFDFDYKGLDRAALIREGYDCATKVLR